MEETRENLPAAPAAETTAPTDFIRDIVRQDLASGKYRPEEIRTRFPPEPNGYLHIGHAKAICLDFGVAREFGGKCNLRMDDTNPGKEDREYYDSIQEDIAWLGYQWDGEVKFASDYFPKMYEFALLMIEKGLAYVDDQSAEEIRATRGTPFQPGVDSPWRNRSVEENLDLFQRMKAGEFPNGAKVLRAKIDMASPNINFRDPVMYRILHESHERTGGQWCIYPMYDWAHGLEDSLEGVTHSLCTLEFEIHRPLYNWFLEPLPIPRKPRQIEFSRLNLTYTVMSKRKLLRLVQEGHVAGWDDPRMPTVRGLRRRGYTPASIRNFVAAVGITKFNGVTDVGVLENTLREELNHDAPRYMAVLHPLKVTITNFPEGQVEWLEAVNNPEKPEEGTRRIPFGRHLVIEQEDFQETPPPKYFRLAPGREVRLRWGYFIRCQEVVKDEQGRVVELLCTYDPETKGGNAPDGRKVKGTIHWVEDTHAVPATVRVYDRLFKTPEPDVVEEGHDFLENLNPDSLQVLEGCRLEAGLAGLPPETRVQFERLGYFVADWRNHRPGAPVFNKTVSLKDSWAKIAKKV
ncbi:MAG: glutamine--tRNA ligase/YqeY domain fusion protein [Oligosphaeraceae bacterium]